MRGRRVGDGCLSVLGMVHHRRVSTFRGRVDPRAVLCLHEEDTLLTPSRGEESHDLQQQDGRAEVA